MSIKKIRERRQQIIAQLREQVEFTTVGATRRHCGECQACCYAIAVHLETDLTECEDKPNYTTCKHQCSKGCAIYNNRPSECRTYDCMWSSGVLTNEEYRSDKLGVIVDFREARGDKTGKNVDCLVFWETREGALQEPNVRRLITWCMKNLKVRIMHNKFNAVTIDTDGRIRKALL